MRRRLVVVVVVVVAIEPCWLKVVAARVFVEDNKVGAVLRAKAELVLVLDAEPGENPSERFEGPNDGPVRMLGNTWTSVAMLSGFMSLSA